MDSENTTETSQFTSMETVSLVSETTAPVDSNILQSHPASEDENLTSEELAHRLELEKLFRSNLANHLDEEYKRYAIEQHPKDHNQQRQYFLQLQNEYYLNYLQYVQTSLAHHQRNQLEQILHFRSQSKQLSGDQEQNDEANCEIVPRPLIPARLWTKPEIVPFKKEILTTLKECCIKISSLAITTVSVPTHIDGNSIWWEFATDSYDLGFGLLFEWSLDPSDKILVTTSESDDEDEEELVDEENPGDEESSAEEELTRDSANNGNSAENADGDRGRKRRRRHSTGLPTDELVPIIRRDCHLNLYCGMHDYPGQGRYLFKFDNSFSLLRSKWLYYRIYYAKK